MPILELGERDAKGGGGGGQRMKRLIGVRYTGSGILVGEQ
jgi:hypothetical protein